MRWRMSSVRCSNSLYLCMIYCPWLWRLNKRYILYKHKYNFFLSRLKQTFCLMLHFYFIIFIYCVTAIALWSFSFGSPFSPNKTQFLMSFLWLNDWCVYRTMSTVIIIFIVSIQFHYIYVNVTVFLFGNFLLASPFTSECVCECRRENINVFIKLAN